MTLLARGWACAHGSRLLPRQSNDCIWVRLEIEPPRGAAFVPVVDRERDQVGAVFEVADEDAALLPGLPPDGRQAQRTPAALVRRGPKESTATESVEGAMNAPARVHEPGWRDLRRSGCCRIAHGYTSRSGDSSSTVRRCTPLFACLRELLTLLGRVEADDHPRLARASPAQCLHPMIAVLDQQETGAVRDDDRWKLGSVVDELGHLLHVVPPLVFVGRPQHGMPGRPGEPVQPLNRQRNGAQPVPAWFAQLGREHLVVATRAGEELGNPFPELAALGGSPGGLE